MNRENITLKEILKDSKYDQIRNQMIHSFLEDTSTTYLDLTLSELAIKQPTWNPQDILFGIDRLNKEDTIPFYRIYNEEEIHKSSILKDIGFIFLKAKEKKKDYFVILLSGGAFGSCCNLVESIPVAARLNELGIDAIVLTYETANKESFKNGLMPNPLDNISRTLDYIKKYSSSFHLDPKNYCVGGFSAGSYVASIYGNKYMDYKQEKPLTLLLTYPLLSILSIENEKMRNLFLTGLYGFNSSLENEKKYNTFHNIDIHYPPTYMILAKDDYTVPSKDPSSFFEELNKLHIPSNLEIVNCGGHGFGLGDYTDAKGYIERFIAFTEKQNERK